MLMQVGCQGALCQEGTTHVFLCVMLSHSGLHTCAGLWPVLQVWRPDQVKCSIAVTSDSNKAFIYWASHGEQTDTHDENHFYGLNLLVFNDQGMVKEILGFRQPLASERPKLLKADAKAATT